MSSLYRHLLRLFLPVALIPLLLLCAWLSWDLGQRRHTELYRELREQVVIARRLLDQSPVDPGRLLRAIAGQSDLRLTLIRADGTVIADTREDPARMEDHSGRPEVAAAQRGGEGLSERYSHTVSEKLLYLALPVEREGRTWGVLRGALPLSRLREEQARLWTGLALT
ncbi:MAG TPA: hypothetical protein VFU47_03270, partial [Armatimonadota bacterium]|nr:hypothetical protein [Armatimonadota bacterium]